MLALRVPELDLKRTLVAALKASGASLIMAVAIWLWLNFLGNGIVAALFAIVAGIAMYFGAAWLLGSDEINYVIGIVQARLARRRAVTEPAAITPEVPADTEADTEPQPEAAQPPSSETTTPDPSADIVVPFDDPDDERLSTRPT